MANKLSLLCYFCKFEHLDELIVISIAAKNTRAADIND